jgi:hypothetical protein
MNTMSERYKDPVTHSLVQQACVLTVSCLFTDFGTIAQISVIAIAGFWAGATLVLFRRPQSPSSLDLWLIRWGFLPLLAIVQPLTQWIWRWRFNW